MQDFCKSLCRGLSVWVSSHSPETSRTAGDTELSTCECESDSRPYVSARWWTAHLSSVNPPLTQCQLGLAPVCRNPAEVIDDGRMDGCCCCCCCWLSTSCFCLFPHIRPARPVISRLRSNLVSVFCLSCFSILTILPVFPELHPLLGVLPGFSCLHFWLGSFFRASICLPGFCIWVPFLLQS